MSGHQEVTYTLDFGAVPAFYQAPARLEFEVASDLLVSANRAMNVSVMVSREKERAYTRTQNLPVEDLRTVAGALITVQQ